MCPCTFGNGQKPLRPLHSATHFRLGWKRSVPDTRGSGMTKLTLIASISLFGALGALTRIYLGGFIQGLLPAESPVRFTLGTLTVNVLGCFLFGVLGYLGHHTEWLSPFWRTVLLSGLLGSFTTFSTFAFETVLLYENAAHGRLWLAAANVALSVCLGIGGILLGMQAGRLLSSG